MPGFGPYRSYPPLESNTDTCIRQLARPKPQIKWNQSTFVKRHKSRANRRRVKKKARPSGYRKLWQKVPSLKHVWKQSVLVERQLYGSEFHTESELRLKDFADIVRYISSELLLRSRPAHHSHPARHEGPKNTPTCHAQPHPSTVLTLSSTASWASSAIWWESCMPIRLPALTQPPYNSRRFNYQTHTQYSETTIAECYFAAISAVWKYIVKCYILISVQHNLFHTCAVDHITFRCRSWRQTGQRAKSSE